MARHRSGWRWSLLVAQPGFDQRCLRPAELLRLIPFCPHLCLDLLQVVEAVGERRMDISERERRNLSDNLVRAHPLVLMPYHHIQHAHPVASDARPAAADGSVPRDPALCGGGHNPSMTEDLPGSRDGVQVRRLRYRPNDKST